MRHPPLQAPLLWQTYLGFWITGITAAPWPLPSLCFALLLFVADARLWQWARTIFYRFFDYTNASNLCRKSHRTVSMIAQPPTVSDSMFSGIIGSWRDIRSRHQPLPVVASQLTRTPS